MRVIRANRGATTRAQGADWGALLSRFGLWLILGFLMMRELKIWQFLRGSPNLTPPPSVLNLPFPENSASKSAAAEKKEVRAIGRGFTEIGYVSKSREIYQKEPGCPLFFFDTSPK